MLNSPLRSPLSPLLRAMRAGNSTPSVPSFYFNFSNPSNVTLGAAQARGTITSTQNAHITMSASLSRVVGVAPLYVNIDMTGTTSNLPINATHDLFYSVNWGDSGAGQWANGVQSAGLTDKNWSFGPVSGHVFETPGTYLVTPTSTDGVNSAAKPGYVTVLDPNVVYAGNLTICISHSNNFTGAPSGATQVNTAGNTDMYAAWVGIVVKTGKRILFCKADNWTASASIEAGGLTGAIIGGYGTGVAHTFSSGTMVSVTPAIGVSPMFNSSNASDVKFCNFRVAANATTTAFQADIADDTQITWYKMEVRGAYNAFDIIPNLGMNVLFKHEQVCIYECLHDQPYGYANMNPPQFAGATSAIGTPGVFTATGHNFKRFNRVRLVGTPPAPLATETDYYISASNLTANTFCLSASMHPDVALALSGAGSCDVVAQGLGGGQGLYVSSTRGGIMGSYFDNCNNGEQVMRLPYTNTSHITNNYLARPNQTKNALKIHSRGYENIVGIPGISGYSEKIVVSANFIDLRGGYSYNEVIPNNGQVATFVGEVYTSVGHGSISEGPNEKVRNVIFESNYAQGCLGNPKDTPAFIAIGCPNATIRNNIADLSIGSDRASPRTGAWPYTHLHFAEVGTSTQDQTVGVSIYNNTLYSNMSSAESAYFVRISDAVTNPDPDQITIKNNIWYTPFHSNASRGAVYNQNDASTNITATNNTDTVAAGGSVSPAPNFAVHPPVALADWRPNTGSYAIDSGTVVPVLKDFNMANRTGAYDMGAVLP